MKIRAKFIYGVLRLYTGSGCYWIFFVLGVGRVGQLLMQSFKIVNRT